MQAAIPVNDPLITTDEFCLETKISPRTAERWRLEGKGPRAIRVGSRLVRYRRSDIDAWLTGQNATTKGRV